jgi:hypothetical protein
MKRALPIFLFLVPACVPSVDGSSPMPKVALQKQSVTMHIHIDAGIKNEFDAKVAKPDGGTISVTDWRGTLLRGFKNGFSPFFTIVEEDQPADLLFDLQVAELAFPFDPSVKDSASMLAQVRVEARVVDKKEQVLASAKGRPRSRTPFTDLAQATAATEDGVAAMYEALSTTFFANIAASQPASQMAK